MGEVAQSHLDEELQYLDEENTRRIEQPGGLRLFLEDAWPILEPSRPFVAGWHHDAICDHTEAVTWGHIQDLIITVPPRHSKSLAVAVAWPCWEWGPAAAPSILRGEGPSPEEIKRRATFPSLRWLFSAYAQSLSTRDSQKRRRVIASPWYQSRWGGCFTIGGNRWVTDGTVKYENDRTGYHMATSVKGSNTGEGGDRIVVDDPINIREIQYELARERANEWWDQVMSTRRNDNRTAARVIIMQRAHEEDLVGHVMKKVDQLREAGLQDLADDYVLLNLPAVYEGKKCFTKIGFQDPREKVGELLEPKRFGEKAIAKAKVELGPFAFSAQYQQRPTPLGGGLLKTKWWRFWAPAGHQLVGTEDTAHPLIREWRMLNEESDDRGMPYKVEALPRTFDECIQSWDATFDDTDSSDYVVGQAWGKVKARAYLLGQIRDQMSFTATQDALLDLTRAFPMTRGGAKLVEDKANGPAIVDSLRGVVSGIIAWPVHGSKDARVAAVTPQPAAGQIFLPHPDIYPWVGDLVHELAMFPKGTNDDQVDAFTQALIRFFHREQFTTGRFASIDLG